VRPLTGHELPFLKAHSPLPIKMTLRLYAIPAISFKSGVTTRSIKTFGTALWDIVEIMKRTSSKLSPMREVYPDRRSRYSYYMDPKWQAWIKTELEIDPAAALNEAVMRTTRASAARNDG